MKNLLQNPWILAGLAGTVFFLSTAGVLFLRKDSWMPPPPVAPVVERVEDPLEARLGFSSLAMEELAQFLEARKASLEMRERQLEEMKANLQLEVRQLEEARQSLDRRQDQLNQYFNLVEAGESQKLKKLAGIYAEMEPEQVVKILREFPEDRVVGLLRLMNDERVREIFAAMLEEPTPPPGEGEPPPLEPAARVAALSQRLTRTLETNQASP